MAVQNEPPTIKVPSIRSRKFLQILLTSTVFLLLGYLLTYLLGTKMLLVLAEQYIAGWNASTTELAKESTLDPFIQILCGLPCTFFSAIPVLIILPVLLKRFQRSQPATVWVLLAILSFITGMLIFVPMQFLLLLAYAF